eukprot:NODE_505_length_7533_cov_0.471886.p3 type:complete len:373 gc:universal NODE_505_length_7533_cov_0.471886:4540-3422(-)
MVVIECRAAVCWGAKEDLKISTVLVDDPKSGEVRIKCINTALCHTDEYTKSGSDPEGIFPVILGHETVGIVESVGPDVTSLSVGDTVIPLYIPECKTCKFCKSNKTNLCSLVRGTQGKGVMPDGTSRFTHKDTGKKIYHFMGTSTFSEYSVVLEISCAKVRKDAPPDKICLLGCGLTTGFCAASKLVESNSTCAVFGLGGVGLACVQGCSFNKADRIIAIDVNPNKFKLAMELGATECINPNDIKGLLQNHLVNITDGGLDYTFDCTGSVDVMRTALEACHKGWGISTIIGVAASGKEISTRPFQLVTGRQWRGSAFGGVKGRTELPGLVDDYMNGSLKIDEFVTHKLPFEKINEAFALLKTGECIRCVLYF